MDSLNACTVIRVQTSSLTPSESCALAGFHKVRTSPCHPRGNPVERYNRTLFSMLGTLRDKKKTPWRDHVRPLTHAYNCTRNDVTRFSPYELMFGRQPRLPLDLAFGLPVKEPSSHSVHTEPEISPGRKLSGCYWKLSQGRRNKQEI